MRTRRPAPHYQLKALMITARAQLREQLRHLSTTVLIMTCAKMRPTGDFGDPDYATKVALRRLARRHLQLTEEVTDADGELKELITVAAPHMPALPGVGAEVAGQLLVTAGDTPERLCSEAAFAPLRSRSYPGR